MTTNHHTAIPFAAPATSAVLEAPLGQLDAAIASVIATGSGASTTLTAQANAGQKNMVVASGVSFPNGAVFWIGDVGGTHETGVIASGGGTGTLVAAVNLANTYAIGKPVSISPVELVDARGVYTTAGGRLAAIEGRVTDVKRYGAVGNDVADDGAAIAAASVAAGVGGTVLFPGRGPYKITAAIAAAIADQTWLSTGGAEIHQVTSGAKGIAITAAGNRVEGLILRGPQHAATVVNERAIEFAGASAAAPLTRGVVERCLIKGWGEYGVLATWARDITVVDSKIEDINYAGVMYLSVIRGEVSGNTIRNIVDTPNAYGISLSRTNGTLATFPRCQDITVAGNVIEDVLNWEGIDTHGGQRITILGNTVNGCEVGIAVTNGEDGAGVAAFAPLDVTVVGNTIYSGKTDGTAGYGIAFNGAIVTTGTPIEKATGSIVGNVIRGHGQDDVPALNGAIYAHTTQGLVIANNEIIEPSPLGINLYHDNYEYVVSGNTVIDPWSNAGAGIVAAIATRGTFNRGYIGGNLGGKDAKAATTVLNMGIRLASDVTNSITNLGINYLEEATTPLSDAGNDARLFLRTTKLGFYSTAPIAKPAVTGSRGGNAALASALTQLAALGLITDNSTA